MSNAAESPPRLSLPAVLAVMAAEAAGEERKPVSKSVGNGGDFGGLSAAFDSAFANVEWQPGEVQK